MSLTRPAVSVRDVWMTFPGKQAEESIPVLEHVSLEVEEGEFVCIVGPSGCGKSTLLNIIGGFFSCTRGEVIVQGQPVHGPDPRRIFVFQENGVFPWLTVQENIGFGLLRKGQEERRRLVAHYIEMVGLNGFERAYPRELSGGMKQRVEIARALAANPDIIYMDEPFGALDFITRLKMRSDLTRIWQSEKKTILFVTHDIEEAVQLADRVLVMSRRPATIQTIVPIDLPRPRDLDSPGYLETRDRIFAAMGMSLRIGDADGDTRGHSSPPGGKEFAVAAARRITDPPPVSERIPTPDLLPRSSEPPVAASVEREVPLGRFEVRDNPLDADVIIIGAGPAGSTLGAYLSAAGLDHLILDQAVHPRPHVGESLLCSTTRIFEEIGFLPVMEREGFVHKRGAIWTHWADERRYLIRFREIPELGLVQDYTYHVDRSRFDQLLLQHVEAKGSRVIQGARAEQVEFDTAGRATGVRVKQEGQQRMLRCKLVVDASGRGTLLGSQLRLKHADPSFHQFAVHNWFEGVDRGEPDTADYIHIHVLPLPRAWVWMIPINHSITSVGIVTEGDDFVKGNESAEAFFARHVASQKSLAERLASARPLHDFTREGNYSYVMDRFAGDGWILVGDAARFVDPVFSSGVSVAMESAKRAAAAIVAASRRNNFGAASFTDYERTVRAGIEVWREFIHLYYQLPPLFLDQLTRPEARGQLTRLLQGDVYERATVPILEQMREQIANIAVDRDHPWHPHLSIASEPKPR